MADRDDVCVLIPTYNEAEAIGNVIDDYRGAGFEHVLVIDGESADATQEIAADHGARVVEQSGSGKGQAVREAVRMIEQPYVLMLDGDATYRAADADAMLEPLFSGRADHVIGDRFADMETGAMTRLNGFGNRLINGAFRFIHGRDLQDILSGYRAFTTDSFQRLNLEADGFGIETEMAVECVKHNVPTAVVPIRYEARPDESETNLRPFRDGGVIIFTLYQMAKTNNPLFYFGSVGALSTITGLGLGAWVAVEWFTRNVSHEVIAFVAGVAILFGVQLLMFGILSDMIVAVNREQTRQLEELTRQLGEEVRRPPAAESDRTAETETPPAANPGRTERD
ncbi:S-layer glycoprotein N-glycosyltransferase AglJ [Haloarculaceae archaeon H-GB1-1]|nr:S-layer glycoprotein N-glycosyltransferase AglJ [Haloarculaceae archaeon H-GB1-1]